MLEASTCGFKSSVDYPFHDVIRTELSEERVHDANEVNNISKRLTRHNHKKSRCIKISFETMTTSQYFPPIYSLKGSIWSWCYSRLMFVQSGWWRGRKWVQSGGE